MIELAMVFLPLVQGIAFQPIALPPQDVRLVTVTAYSSTHDQTDQDPWITASNKKVKDGFAAINGLKFGTKFKLPDLFGDKVFEVQDRKNRRYNSTWIDIWMPNKRKAKEFGIKRKIKAVIL